MKKYLSLILMIILTVSLTGCADHPTAKGQPTARPEENNAPVLAEGETITIDGTCEFRMNYATIAEHPESFFEAEAGKAYVDFCITYTNLGDYIITANQIMEGKLIYSGQYEYDGINSTVDVEDGRPWDYAHTIKMQPSDTRQVHYLFSVPKEVQDSGRMVELNMNIRGDDYRVIVREGEKGAVTDGNAASKTSGTVTDGEAVATDNSEFYVEYAEFSRKVMPPAPNTGYNYYAADEGKVYIDFCIAYKNISGKKIRADKAVSAQLKPAEAKTTVAEQLNRSMFDYANLVNIIPLGTEYIHCIFLVPEELLTNDEPVTISFKIDGNSYTYSLK